MFGSNGLKTAALLALLTGLLVLIGDWLGGTSGMGLATARLAAELGAAVVAAGRRPFEEREPLHGVTQARVDTTDEASVQALFDEVGQLDHLFATGGLVAGRRLRRG